MIQRAIVSLFAAAISLTSAVSAIAGPIISPTEALSPADEKAKFHLPPGFEAQLVVSEPEIQKPMNIQFDARGRLWVTHSTEYPFPASDPEKARDGISILEDFGPDGHARKITKFADKLNIPIGVLPLGDGHEAIAWSIPYIWKLTDTTGSGHADKREILFGPFDVADTHGDQNSFRLGLDGWVYANHGFRNDSKVKIKGEGPVVLAMQSGNTYRFRPDGSAIEQFTFGQVNPFGSCWDDRGQLYNADCHTRAIMLLLHGAMYESFGKPHDGLGYAPTITDHEHGSTGLGGVTYYVADQFPPEYRNCFYVNNVVTNRVHRDVPEWRGSSPWIDHPEDFLVSDDDWFHPVDVQLGPDGCLYVADFYNCIIGHYEVDLKHPRRDRIRGRIWRIVWKGLDGKAAPPRPIEDLTKLAAPQIAEKMGDINLGIRHRATQEAVRRVKLGSALAVDFQPSHKSPEQSAQALWAAVQTNAVSPLELAGLPAESPLVRVHAMRVLGVMANWKPEQAETVRSRLADEDPFVRRAAAEALGSHPSAENIRPILAAWEKADRRDVQYIHAVRIALRNQLRDAGAAEKIVVRELSTNERARLAEIALITSSPQAAWLAFECMKDTNATPEQLGKCLASVTRFADARRADEVAAFAQVKLASNPAQQVALFRTLLETLGQKGQQLSPESEMGRWGSKLATSLLAPSAAPPPAWHSEPLPSGGKGDRSPFGLKTRASADGVKDGLYFDSIVGGEQLTGMLVSSSFVIPEQLSFYMCGHNGLPGTNPPPKNYVRLILAETGEEVKRELPPRSDIAQKYTWNLKAFAGKRGVLQVVDGDSGAAYAWIAVARFEPAVVENPAEGVLANGGGELLAIQVAQQLKLVSLAPRVLALLSDPQSAGDVRLAAVDAAIVLDRDAAAKALATVVQDVQAAVPLRAKTAQQLAALDTPDSRAALSAALAGAPATLQQSLALALAAHPAGAGVLLDTITVGKASTRLLQDKPVAERLASLRLPAIESRIAELTKNLPPADERVNRLIAQRAAAFPKANTSREAGIAVFTKSCAACHKLAGQGAMVGPQLDGIGIRGLERLLEDILDPNRNVDAAFRTTIVSTKDGQVVTGLKLREEGGQIVLADAQGKEVRVVQSQIDTTRISPLSLMPSNFAETMPEADMNQLLAYLLSQKQKP